MPRGGKLGAFRSPNRHRQTTRWFLQPFYPPYIQRTGSHDACRSLYWRSRAVPSPSRARTAFPLRTKNSKTKNHHLTGKAPYKFESISLHQNLIPRSGRRNYSLRIPRRNCMPRSLWPAQTILTGARGRGLRRQSSIWKKSPLKSDRPVSPLMHFLSGVDTSRQFHPLEIYFEFRRNGQRHPAQN
jgi:hypothetical protein